MKNILVRLGKTLALPIIIFLVFAIGNSGNFASARTLLVVLQQSIGPAIVAYGFCFASTIGMTDFSIGSRMIFAEIIGGICAARFGILGVVIGCIGTSLICGILSAVVFRVARIPSFIVAFGLVLIFEVFGSIAAQSFGGTVILTRAQGVLGRMPYNFIILGISMLLFSIMFYRTRFSYQVRAIGSNEIIARTMGINAMNVKCLSYIIGSIFLGIAAIIMLSYSSAVGSQMGMATMSQLFKPMMSIMIARAISKACPMPIGIFVGTFSLNLLFTGIIAIGLLDAFQDVSLGFMMVLVIALSANLPIIQKKFAAMKKPHVS